MTPRRLALAFAGATALVAWHSASAQSTKARLIGSWERFALTESDGTSIQNPPPSLLIFSPDGFYSVTTMYPDRPRVAKELPSMSTRELLARFSSVVARQGKYTIRGDTVFRHIAAHSDPALVGRTDTERFGISGDTLILRGAGQREARYRRPQ